MKMSWAAVHVLIFVVVILVKLNNGRQIYVSHSGNDTKSCGQTRVMSCKSLSYAISLSKENDIIEVDHNGGPYTVVPSSGDIVNITHSVWIRTISKDQHSKLNCSQGKSGMFNVFTPHNESGTPSKTLTFTLERINIQGCVGTWDNPSVIKIANASINIKDSEFGTNGIILHHPQVGGSPCEQVKVSITNSKFTACGFAKPYLSCIIVMGCNTTNVHVQDTQFDYSSVQLQGDENLVVNMVQSIFNGQNLRGPSLDIIFAPNQSQISLTDSVIKGHASSKDSAVRIAIEQPSKFPSLHFTNVTFASNMQTQSSGGAISLVARFGKTPRTINAEFTQCTFSRNSAAHVGGAIYLEGLDTVKLNHCIFEGNTAIDGGAVFILGSQHVTLFNSTFQMNQAVGIRHTKYKGVGGAIRATQSDIMATLCKFTNNTSTFHGQAIQATDMLSVDIESCIFTNATNFDSSPKAQLYLTQTYATNEASPTVAVRLKQNVYDSVNTSNYYGMFHVEVKGLMESDNNTVCCPIGQHVEHVSQPQHTQVGYDPGSSLDEAWCTACPMGSYNLQRDCLVLEKAGMYHKHQLAACVSCPQYAKCTGEGRITALKNYWGERRSPDTNQILFQLCPMGYCDQAYCNDIQCCSNGRVGALCGKCQDGHHLNLATDVCVPEANCQYMFVFSILYSIVFGVVYFTLVLFFVVLTRFCLMPVPGAYEAQQIQHGSRSTMDMSGSTPWEHNSMQPSIRDGDDIQDQLNNPYGSEATNPSLTNSERDNGSDSFEPSLPRDYTHSVDSHGLVPVQDDATQTSDRLNRAILMKTQSNLVTGHPFVLCVGWMLVQLLDEIYQPWYGVQDRRYAIISGILDVVNFRPVYYLLEAPCVSGAMASVTKMPLALICITSMFTILMVTLVLGNIILKVISKIRRSEIAYQRSQLNTIMSQVFLTTLTLVYLPILKCCFRLIHCIRPGTDSQLMLFINGTMSCDNWWHWLVIVVMVVNLAPVGLAIWAGLPLLKAHHVSSLQFTTGLFFPLPAAMYWICRYGKSVCHCLFPYEFHFEVMQSYLYDMNPEHFMTSDALRSFFASPFQILCQSSKHAELPQAEGRTAWIILIFLRGFVFITFSAMLSHWPVVKAIILIMLLLLAIALHVQWQPYGRRSANRFEAHLLCFLALLAILGMNNALVYSMGIEPYGYLDDMLHVNDWVFVILVTVVLAFYVMVVLYYITKATLSKRVQRV